MATPDVVKEPIGQVHLVPAEQVLQGRHDRLDPGPVAARVERLPPGTAVQQFAADLVVFLEEGERLVDRSADLLACSVTIRVVGEGCAQRLSAMPM